MEYSEGETEWDLRQDLTNMIAQFTVETQLKYRTAIKNPGYENLRNYFLEIKNLFRTVKRYADEEGDHQETIKTINDDLESLGKKFNQDGSLEYLGSDSKILEDLEDLDDKVQGLRMDVGLDIPRKKNYNPEDAGLAGLK